MTLDIELLLRDCIIKTCKQEVENIAKLVVKLNIEYADDGYLPDLVKCANVYIDHLDDFTLDEVSYLIEMVRNMCSLLRLEDRGLLQRVNDNEFRLTHAGRVARDHLRNNP